VLGGGGARQGVFARVFGPQRVYLTRPMTARLWRTTARLFPLPATLRLPACSCAYVEEGEEEAGGEGAEAEADAFRGTAPQLGLCRHCHKRFGGV
jgi:hypothetical protein